MSFFTGKKLLLLGFLAVLLAVIPLTVFFLGSQTRTQSKAEVATSLFFALPGQTTAIASPLQKNIGDAFDLDIIINPGTNQVIAPTLSMTYDATKLQVPDKGFKATLIENASQTEGFTSILAGPTLTNGTASVTLTVGVDITKLVKSKQKIATISLKALANTADTKVAFDGTKTNVTSSVDPETNVLLPNPAPATIVIAAAGVPTIAPTASPSATIVPTGPATTLTPNQIPVCTGLNVDRVTTGAAPFSITFTAIGNDPTTSGTITKATFDYGDGPVQDITQGGNIGTKTVNVQVAHTYNNPGAYTAKAILTDNNNGLSKATDCVQTITVTQASASASLVTPTPIAIGPSATPLPPKVFTTPPGPGGAVLGAGIAGIGLTILGGLLFLSL